MPAYYNCKHCNGIHKIPSHFPTKKLFETVPLHHHVCTCPVVDRGAIYRDRDVFWREGRGADRPVGDDGLSSYGKPDQLL